MRARALARPRAKSVGQTGTHTDACRSTRGRVDRRTGGAQCTHARVWQTVADTCADAHWLEVGGRAHTGSNDRERSASPGDTPAGEMKSRPVELLFLY